MFSGILGNDVLKAYLRKAIEEKRLAQTILFAGLDGIGKSLFAKAAAGALLGKNNSPDFHIYGPEGKSGFYGIDTIREMIDKEHEASFEGKGKVFLLEDVERMQPASANALLKTLEEPMPDTTFILLTSHENGVLPTILSRCNLCHFQPLSEEMIEALLHAKGYPKHFAKLAQGSVGRAFELAQHPEIEAQRKRLFALLSKHLSYPELSLELAQFDEKDEDDPLGNARRVEHLFAWVLMWHRDQHLKEIGVRDELLFFPDEPKVDPVPLFLVEQAIDQARLAVQRNMKLSVCLANLVLSINYPP